MEIVKGTEALKSFEKLDSESVLTFSNLSDLWNIPRAHETLFNV